MTDTNNDTTAAPASTATAPAHIVSARLSDLQILNWVNNMIPTIQQYTGRTDQTFIRIEWTPEAALFNATYPEDAPPAVEGEASGSVPAPAEEPAS